MRTGWRSRLFGPLQNSGRVSPRRSGRDRDQLLRGSRHHCRQNASDPGWRRSSVGARIGDQTACPWPWLFEVFHDRRRSNHSRPYAWIYVPCQNPNYPSNGPKIPRSLDRSQTHHQPAWFEMRLVRLTKTEETVLEELHCRSPEPHPCPLDNT